MRIEELTALNGAARRRNHRSLIHALRPAQEPAMKITFWFGRMLFATTAAVALTALSAQGQQPLGGVKLAEPVAEQAVETKADAATPATTPKAEATGASTEPATLRADATAKAESTTETSGGAETTTED